MSGGSIWPLEAGARVVVLGVAVTGEAVARALVELGAAVRVLDGNDSPAQREAVARLGDVEAVLGRTDPADIADAGLIVTSPGVPWGSPWIRAAEDAGIPIWSEIELAFRLGREPLVAITGTNGKTTAVEMTTAALVAAGVNAVAAGNSIGRTVLDAPAGAAIVAEVSSFQLQAIDSFRAPVSVLLNVAHDHLDWHGSFEAYASAKQRLFRNVEPTDTIVVRADPLCGTLAASSRAKQVPFLATSVPVGGAGVEDGWIHVPQGRVLPVEELASPARGLVEDAVAAAAAACATGASPEDVGRGLKGYRPRAHRLELVATIGGVRFVNDSKATDPHATLAALEATPRTVLIAGGRNKGLDLRELAEASGLRAVIAIGEAASEIEAAFAGTSVPVQKAGSMEEAVDRAASIATTGDTVLLSPACASFDMFSGYEERGEAFRAAVERTERSPL